MLNTNRFCLRSVLFIIVLIFSLFGPQGHATAETTQANNPAAETSSAPGNIPLSGVTYNVGDVFAAVNDGKILHFSPTGVLLETLDTGTGGQEAGMAFDLAGNLYVTNFEFDSMSKFDNQGNLLGPFGSGFNSPESVVVDAAGNLYVGQADQFIHPVLKFNANETLLSIYNAAEEVRGTDWIDLATDQCTLFYTSEGKLIKRYDVCHDLQLPDFVMLPNAGQPFDAAYALRIRPNGDVLVATGQNVYRLDAVGNVIQIYPAPAGETCCLFALNLDPDLTSFWTAGIFSGKVYKIDIAGGTVLQSFDTGMVPVGGLAIFGEPVEPSTVDLSITKSDTPDPVTAGDALTYTLTVTNNGPDKATGVNVTDTLPVEVTPVSATPSPGTCILGAVLTCDIGDLDPGASATVTIEVTVDSTVTCGSTLTNRAVVASNESDADLNNNTVSTDTMVTCPPEPCTILDDFNRPNGPLGSNWDGRTRGYRIVNNEVAVRAGGPIYWQPEAYGADQEACVTLTRINPKSKQHALLLKVQELNDWRQGAILVSYNAPTGNVDVQARDVTNHQWILVGSLIPSTLVVDGDQLRVQALADGTVEVFINDVSIGTADAGSFYVDKGGQIGLWFRGRGGEDDDDKDDEDNGDHDDRFLQAHQKDDDDDDDDDGSSARRAWLDDFGGGTLLLP